MIPQGHRDFVEQILSEHDVPPMPEENETRELLGWTAATATPQVECALRHPKVRLIANALGTPPPDIIEEIHREGLLVAALCGAAKQAARIKRPASTSSSRRAPRAAATPATSRRRCCGPR